MDQQGPKVLRPCQSHVVRLRHSPLALKKQEEEEEENQIHAVLYGGHSECGWFQLRWAEMGCECQQHSKGSV